MFVTALPCPALNSPFLMTTLIALEGNTIVAHDCTITAKLKRRQSAMFLEAANRGITHKEVHYATGLSLSIIGQYARGETAMGMPAALKVRKVVGAELFTMLFDDGDYLVEAAKELNHDDLAAGCIEYASTHAKARHPNSPAGVEIAPCEEGDLNGKAATLRAIGG